MVKTEGALIVWAVVGYMAGRRLVLGVFTLPLTPQEAQSVLSGPAILAVSPQLALAIFNLEIT
jgi:hypothetical protein